MIPVIFIDKKEDFFDSNDSIEEFNRRINDAIKFAFDHNIISGDLEFVDANVNINLIQRPVISREKFFFVWLEN